MQENKKINITIKKSNGNVRIQISDQGVGIAKRDYTKLFQKFSRIPNPLSVEVGGTGLGLYWADKVISMHDGKIDVDSTLGEGSVFTIVLPSNSR